MRALILVDIQNDFLPGGALAVPRGDEVVPVANRLQPRFDLIVATQDWHPPEHGSFAANHAGKRVGDTIEWEGLEQVLWPVHCVQGTPGAEFAPSLKQHNWSSVFRKGTDPRMDSYSGFFDNGHRKSTGLGDFLRQQRVEHIYVMGLATDYCVRFTALDARRLGFATSVITDGCRGVEREPGDCDRTWDALRAAGVVLTSSEEAGRLEA